MYFSNFPYWDRVPKLMIEECVSVLRQSENSCARFKRAKDPRWASFDLHRLHRRKPTQNADHFLVDRSAIPFIYKQSKTSISKLSYHLAGTSFISSIVIKQKDRLGIS